MRCLISHFRRDGGEPAHHVLKLSDVYNNSRTLHLESCSLPSFSRETYPVCSMTLYGDNNETWRSFLWDERFSFADASRWAFIGAGLGNLKRGQKNEHSEEYVVSGHALPTAKLVKLKILGIPHLAAYSFARLFFVRFAARRHRRHPATIHARIRRYTINEWWATSRAYMIPRPH